MRYAQTNLQLYNQLRAAGWDDAQQREVHGAYQLAMSIFAGHYRPNHKPFLAHLVGVASILATHGAPATTVAAGLLHSAYSHGEFGEGTRGITPRKRRQVQQVVGASCETLIACYAASPWDLPALNALLADVRSMSLEATAVAFMKLADTLEDHLDLGMEYSPNKRLSTTASMERAWRESVLRLAMALGHDALAADLARWFEASDRSGIPGFLRGSQRSSFVLAPVSHRIRTSVRVGRVYRRWLVKLSRSITPIHRRAVSWTP